eukprot:CAMPEP_0194541658 /NCGR_PEP_ID=MMETSP0253-20130528/82590_1 /TAXON_ID=2966 /ORGANISM="Noctiluca scintillans" /LENGTH=55 /DNA_ID=CAMNT_0039388171 /DNA_START=74 /DNA_END=237 /DNA_ORIENTATION=-
MCSPGGRTAIFGAGTSLVVEGSGSPEEWSCMYCLMFALMSCRRDLSALSGCAESR